MQDPGYLNRASGENPYQECINQAVGELFSAPFVEKSVDRVYRTVLSPSVQIVPSSTEIYFHSNPCEDYTSLKDTLIKVRLRLQTEAGGLLPDFTETLSVGLENYVTTTLFSNIQHKCCNELASGDKNKITQLSTKA